MNLKRIAAVVALIAAALLFFLYKHGEKRMARPNLIFITVDTLRFDHTPFGGYSRRTMPHTAIFFQEGTNFIRTETVRTTTTPAYASMLTGLYPYRHGVRNLYYILNPKVKTLPEILREHGYATAAFVSSFVMMGRFSGLDQGFQVYDERLLEHELTRENYERTAGNTTKEALLWLAKNQNRQPFFLFLHFIDPHGPYHPPDGFNSQYQSSQYNELALDDIPRYQRFPSQLNFYEYVDRYDGEISYVDSQLKYLYTTFEKMGLLENTWFLFNADHGEAMGENGKYFAHGEDCSAAESRVPMVWLPPAHGRSRWRVRKVENAASVVDVTPTALDAAGINPDGELEGESLLPSMRGQSLKNPFRYIEKKRGQRWIYSVYDSRHKLVIKRQLGEYSEYYDLVQDPSERQNLFETTKIPTEMERALASFISKAESYIPPFQVKRFKPASRTAYVENPAKLDLSEEDRENLRALGYVD